MSFILSPSHALTTSITYMDFFSNTTENKNVLVAEKTNLTMTQIITETSNITTHIIVESKAQATINILIIGQAKKHITYHLTCDHLGTWTQATIRIVTIGQPTTKVYVKGTMVVPSETTQAQGHLVMHNILLGPWAHCIAKPELDIHTCEAQVSHGASYEMIDATHLFYLTSKWLTLTDAQKLILRAHIASCIHPITTVVDQEREMMIEELLEKCLETNK